MNLLWKNTIRIAAAAWLLASAAAAQAPLRRFDARIDTLLAAMTLEEKVAMLHGNTLMSSAGVPRLGIAEMKYSDCPFGVTQELKPRAFEPAGWSLDSATCFPTGSALAATWSPELAYQYGAAIGREARRRGKDMLLGPAINIQRLPVGGRTYEYLSEDPRLSAALAAGYTRGAQSAGVAVCLKHYALNNQELLRGSVNVIIGERAMREIYLKPFAAAVREGGALGVMAAYNKVNGWWCAENAMLLQQLLRKEWDFQGVVISDWGGTHSTVHSALNGLDIEMPGSGGGWGRGFLDQALIDSVRSGAVPMAVIDTMVRHVLRVRLAVAPVPAAEANLVMTSQPEGQKTAYAVAASSVVLLKNSGGVLPIDLTTVKNIAIIGENAVLKTAMGGWGAGVKALYEITPLQGLQERIGSRAGVHYARGYRSYAITLMGKKLTEDTPDSVNQGPDPERLAEAVALARRCDLVLFFAGTNKWIETESADRVSLRLPSGQDEIARALAAANPRLVTIIVSGGPVDLRTIDAVSPAIVQAWWNGSEGGHALADILLGKIAPSGRLPMTWPLRLEDSPAFALGTYPQKAPKGAGFGHPVPGPDAPYAEESLVGYRWYDTKNLPVMYPFGHGLSYVEFGYASLRTDKSRYGEEDTLQIMFTLTNKGQRPAEEVAQIYVHRRDARVKWPYKELKAFTRVALEAGESRKVTLAVPVRELRYWDETSRSWRLEHGRIELLVGASSRDIRLKRQVQIR